MSAAARLETPAPVADPMAPVRALNRMRAAGFSLSLDDGRLMVEPLSRLNDAQRSYLRSHKAALAALLNDAETLAAALQQAGPAGLAWREGTPGDWSDDRLLAAGEVLYADGRMVNRRERRYAAEAATRAGLSEQDWARLASASCLLGERQPDRKDDLGTLIEAIDSAYNRVAP